MKWKPWLYGLAYAFIGGGAGAMGVGVIDPEHFSPFVKDGLKHLAEAFVLPGLFSVYAYLKQSPLPKLEE